MPELSARILVVEEDPTLGSELKHALEQMGCDVVVVRDGPKGLARAVTDRFDAILLSADLPRMNGFRVCKRIREDARARTTPLFLMGDANTEQFTTHDKLPSRADVYLTKPIVIGELAAGLKNVLAVRTTSKVQSFNMAAALASAETEAGNLVELRRRLGEQDTTVARLTRELAAARKDAQKKNAPPAPPPAPKPAPPPTRGPMLTPATDLRELARQKEEISRLEAALASSRTEKTKAHADEVALFRAELAAVRAELSETATEAAERKVTLEVAMQEYARSKAALEAEVARLKLEIDKREADAKALREATLRDAEKAKSLQTARDAAVDAQRRAERKSVEIKAQSEEEVQKFKSAQRERGVAALERHAADLAELEKRFETALAAERATAAATLEEERARVRQLEAKLAEGTRASKEVHVARQAALEAAKAVSNERQARMRAEKRIVDLERAAEEEKRSRDGALAELEAERTAHATSRGELAAARAAAEEERSARADDQHRTEALEASTVAQQQVLEAFHRDVMEARGEIGELEAEIAVLRGELTNVRRELDHEAIASAALEAEVERSREMLRRARALLDGSD